MAEWGVAVDGEGTADVADAGGRVLRRVAVGGRSAQLVADTDGRLQVLTLFKALCCRHPDRFQPGQLRTLQRRVRDWRVQYGPDSEVYCRPSVDGSNPAISGHRKSGHFGRPETAPEFYFKGSCTRKDV